MSLVQTTAVVFFLHKRVTQSYNRSVILLFTTVSVPFCYSRKNRKLSLNTTTTTNILTITFEKVTPTIHKNNLGFFSNMLLGEKTTQTVRRMNSNRGDTRGRSTSYKESFFSVFFKCALQINTMVLWSKKM